MINFFSGGTDETPLDDPEEDADFVVVYEVPSDECLVSSENSESKNGTKGTIRYSY